MWIVQTVVLLVIHFSGTLKKSCGVDDSNSDHHHTNDDDDVVVVMMMMMMVMMDVYCF
jgi:hypothetical protein